MAEGKASTVDCSSAFHVSVCITFTLIPLANTNCIAEPELEWQGTDRKMAKGEQIWRVELELGNCPQWASKVEMNCLNRDISTRMNLRFCCHFWFVGGVDLFWYSRKFCVSVASCLYFCKSGLQPVELLLHCRTSEPYSSCFCLLSISIHLKWFSRLSKY